MWLMESEAATEDSLVAYGEALQTTPLPDAIAKAFDLQRAKAKVGPIGQAKPPVDRSEFDLGGMSGRIPDIKEREQEWSTELSEAETAENTEDYCCGSTTKSFTPPLAPGWQAPGNLKNDPKYDNPAKVVEVKKLQPKVFTHHSDTKSVVDDTPDTRGNKKVIMESEYQVAERQIADSVRALAASSGRAVTDVLVAVAKLLLIRQPKPNRLRWNKDNLPGEHAATFAVRAYAAEYEAGTLTTSLIAESGDKALCKKILNDKRTPRKWPKGIDIPTKEEWLDRKLAERDGEVPRPKHIVLNREDANLYHAARNRVAHAPI